ncbi:phosphatase PAP2 family protein [Bulleidia sp. zg-1006]|uniref:phosphatase PAP2 family protein n=1 Tax=Bulleidia sp. zg-1006 TaxID=2806552 RepID=UPI0019395433|nr:phosphatase PAP2 family protein [Bulleidia sp. zg-1006]QRG87069.1 phosphatase PAP2 family protein [Bulleidia sp. zg-1006]
MELKILRFLQDLFPNPFWIHLNQGMSFLGDGGLIWFITMIVLWFIPEYHYLSKLMLVTIAIQALVVNVMLKPLFKRTRPFYSERNRLLLKKEPKDSSFPSAHSSSSFAMAGLMVFTKFPYWPIYLVIACGIALSRLVLFAHWLSDVIVGIIIGLLIAYIMVYYF